MAVLVSLLSASVPGQAGTEHVPDPAPVFGHSLKTQDAKTCKWVEPQNVIGQIVLVLIHIVLPFLFPLFLFQFTSLPAVISGYFSPLSCSYSLPYCYFRLLSSMFPFWLVSIFILILSSLPVSLLPSSYLNHRTSFRRSRSQHQIKSKRSK